MSKTYWAKRDWRNEKMPRHEDHIAIRWFHWSWRPRLVMCYFDHSLGEQRHRFIKLRLWGM